MSNTKSIREVAESIASMAQQWVDEKYGDWRPGLADIIERRLTRFSISKSQTPEVAEPVAYAARLEANVRGFLDVMAWKEGEFTIPLYKTPQPSPVAEVAEPVQLPPLTDVMYHACRGLEYEFSAGGPESVTGYLDDNMLDDIWNTINTALRCATPQPAPSLPADFIAAREARQEAMYGTAPSPAPQAEAKLQALMLGLEIGYSPGWTPEALLILGKNIAEQAKEAASAPTATSSTGVYVGAAQAQGMSEPVAWPKLTKGGGPTHAERKQARIVARQVQGMPAREVKNQLCIDGSIDAAFNAILATNEPDAVRVYLVELAHKAVDAAVGGHQQESSTGAASEPIDGDSATTIQGMPEWADPRVQTVYEILCRDDAPPNPDEHWEGYMARRIAAALAEHQPPSAVEDAKLLDWLETKAVTVRTPLRYGSRDEFSSMPTGDEESVPGPSDIRQCIRAAIEASKP